MEDHKLLNMMIENAERGREPNHQHLESFRKIRIIKWYVDQV